MNQFLLEELKESLAKEGNKAAEDIISYLIDWYSIHGVAIEVRTKGIFKEEKQDA